MKLQLYAPVKSYLQTFFLPAPARFSLFRRFDIEKSLCLRGLIVCQYYLSVKRIWEIRGQ